MLDSENSAEKQDGVTEKVTENELTENVNDRYGPVELLHKINVIWFGMALLCVPVWWATTTVTRYDIPFKHIEQLEAKARDIKLSQKRYLRETIEVARKNVPPKLSKCVTIKSDIQYMIYWFRIYCISLSFQFCLDPF